MEEKIKSLQYKTKANDVDEKGIVTVAVNGIGVKDSQNDISMPGSFNKTLKENIGRMRWFLNHRTDQLLGVPLSGKETEGNLVMVGQLNLEKQIGRDTLADYKLFAENGRTPVSYTHLHDRHVSFLIFFFLCYYINRMDAHYYS